MLAVLAWGARGTGIKWYGVKTATGIQTISNLIPCKSPVFFCKKITNTFLSGYTEFIPRKGNFSDNPQLCSLPLGISCHAKRERHLRDFCAFCLCPWMTFGSLPFFSSLLGHSFFGLQGTSWQVCIAWLHDLGLEETSNFFQILKPQWKTWVGRTTKWCLVSGCSQKSWRVARVFVLVY